MYLNIRAQEFQQEKDVFNLTYLWAKARFPKRPRFTINFYTFVKLKREKKLCQNRHISPNPYKTNHLHDLTLSEEVSILENTQHDIYRK